MIQSSFFDIQSLDVRFLAGDAEERLAGLPAGSIQTIVTSPPYFGLRDYGVKGQIGHEVTPAEYIERLRLVFARAHRALRDDGTLWVNIGDSYSESGRGGNTKAITGEGANASMRPRRGAVPGIPGKNLIGIPWRLAFALQDMGWILRQEIIWAKPNPLPESVRDRCTKSHETIFLFAKREKYFFDHLAIREPAICGPRGSQFHTGKTGLHQQGRAQKVRSGAAKGSFKAKGEPLQGQLPFRAIREMRNKRSVWTVSSKPYRGAHFAVFPPDLIEPCILAGSRAGDVVCDPFMGSGTTGLVATRHGRGFIGIDLDPKNLELAHDRIQRGK